jgi:catechol 2,3-dioxygenase-like lactoylglutathione lyase family enzyme
MNKLVPLLKSFDMARSLAFYQNILGAKVNWQWQQDHDSANPSYASLSLFEQEVHLSSFAGDGAFGSAIYFYMDDVDTLYKQISAAAPSSVDMKPTLLS